MDEFDRIFAAGISHSQNNGTAKKASSKINRALLEDYCPNCGAPTSDAVCEYCDSLIPAKKPATLPATGTPAAKAQDEVFCHSCGKLIKATVDFCPHCGANQRTQEVVEYYETENNDNNTAAAVAGAAVGFVAGAVAKNVAKDFIDDFFS